MLSLMTLVFNAAGLVLFTVGLLAVLHPSLAGRLVVFVHKYLWPGLNTRIRIERYYYRHHRISGLVTLAGGMLLVCLSLVITGNFSPLDEKSLEAVLRDAGAVLFLVSGLIIIVTGMVVFFRPSLLKPLESWANQPVTRKNFYAFCAASAGWIRNVVVSHPRWTGLLAALTGLGLIRLAG